MEQKKVSPNRLKKQQIVAKLSEKVTRAKGFVFTNYQGLTHKQLEALKKRLKAANADLIVTKNTLLKLALLNSKLEARNSKQYQNSLAEPDPASQENDKNSKHLSVSDFDIRISDFEGPTATLFLYGDTIEPLKQLAKTIKELNLPTVKFGIIDKQTLTSEQVLSLAALPPYNVLIAQLLFQIKAPLFGLHRALGWNIQKLVMTLQQIKNQKSKIKNTN